MSDRQDRKKFGSIVGAAAASRMAMMSVERIESQGRIAFVNDSLLMLTGHERSDTEGISLIDFFYTITDAITASKICEALDKESGGLWEAQCRRADKTEFLAAMFLTPVFDDQGIVQNHLISFVDLGQPVARLLDHRNELHALYEHAPGFIATSEGPCHRFTFANASYQRFVGRQQLVGLTVAEALPEIVDQGFVELLDHVFRTGEPFVGRNMAMEMKNVASGAVETRFCDFVYQAVRNASDTITGLFCEGYDVTDRRASAVALAALESELIHVSRVNAMGTMATTLAHELNQPLSAITNYAVGAQRLIGTPSHDPSQLAEVLQSIEEASHRAGEIIRNLRELTRRREPARLAFDLKVAVAECIRLIRATASPGITISDAIPDGLMMAADRVQIQQVVINLLRNACDAVHACKRRAIVIDADAEGAHVTVRVADTGPGVPLEAARNIFSWSDTAKDSGMGLGLSICRTIIEAHRGRIWLEHSGRNGSEFRFWVPRT